MELILPTLLGLVAAWVVNYLSDTLPTQRKIGQPACPHCNAPQPWGDYLKMSACRKCKKRRSWRTLVTFFTGILLSLWLWLNPPAILGYWLGLVILIFFGVVTIIDLEHRLILHMVTLTGAVLGLITGIILHGWLSTLIGGVAGLGVMLIFYYLGTLFARYRARKLGVDDDEEALGFGDVTLSGVLGLFLGWPLIMFGLFFGVLAGGIVSFLLIIILLLTKRYHSMTVFTAYGPYLVLGAAILLYTPQALTILSGK